ncbi:MAG: MFS transporter [Coriobacteriales bacterium]|jgi:UMF1 family MFS transporter
MNDEMAEDILGDEGARGSKMTKKEKSWVLYDVGNSAFTMMVSTIIPIYYNWMAGQGGVSSVDYLASWGYAISIATLISAVLGVLLGTISDHRGFKKKIFTAFVAVGAVACILLGVAQSWIVFIVVFVVARIAYSDSLVFYDSMLIDVTVPERMDKVSAHGYAWGYIGSCIPFIACLALNLFYEDIGITFNTAMLLSFIITAVWWAGTTIPLLRCYKQIHYAPEEGHPVSDGLKRLGRTFKQVKQQKHIFIFLLAFFFFIDGVYTIIDMATAYGTALGLDTTGLLLALLVTQFVAFPCAIIFGKLADRFATGKLILVCIAAYFCIAVYAIFLSSQFQFWVLAVCVGIFQGGIQAMARSYYAKLIPAKQSGEYFGLFDICGKGASVMGSFLVSAVSQLTGSMNLGVGAISAIMIVGFVLMIWSDRLANAHFSKSGKIGDVTVEETAA